MSEVKVVNNGDKFTHASVGSLKTFEGKQFVRPHSIKNVKIRADYF